MPHGCPCCRRRAWAAALPLLALLALGLAAGAAVAVESTLPQPVPRVELSRYLGTWHEVRRIPNRFQDNRPEGRSACHGATADYRRAEEGRIAVTNTCRRYGPDGAPTADVARALARVVPDSGNARLVVNFTGIALLRWLGIGDGDYWILALGPPLPDGRYAWVLVGEPERRLGWLLARRPTVGPATQAAMLAAVRAAGYDPGRFQAFPAR